MHKYCPKSCKICTPGPDDYDDFEDDDGDDDDDDGCVDTHERCEFWASSGECDANPRYMHENCAKSCNTCAMMSAPVVEKIESIEQQSTKFGVEQEVAGENA